MTAVNGLAPNLTSEQKLAARHLSKGAMSSLRLLTSAGSRERWPAAGRAVCWLVTVGFAYKIVRVTWLRAHTPTRTDFLFFWDAARHVLNGQAAQVYSAHATALGSLEPLGYPPPLLLLIWPLGLVGYGTAITLWLAVTGGIFWFSARQPLPLVLTNPPAAVNVLFGQSSFLTGAFFLGGITSLRRPRVAGLIIGGLVIKPHLALLIPLALAAGGYWWTLAYAALSSAVLIVISAIAFKPGIYVAWWNSLSHYGGWLVNGYWPWDEVASVYGMLRWGGVSFSAAMIAHLLVAAAAAFLVWRSWREQWSCRIEVAATATLLASPYLFTYDAILLAAPLGWLWTRAKGAAFILWIVAMAPLAATSFVGSYPFKSLILQLPSTIPIASIVALVMLARNEKLARYDPAVGTG